MDAVEPLNIQELQTENAALRRYLVALGEIALAGEAPLDALLQRIVDEARVLLHARYAALGAFDEQGRVKQFFTAGISPEERRKIGSLPTGAGLLGLIIKERRVIRVARIADHPSSVGFPPHLPPMTSFIGGPIVRGERIYGNLYLTDRIGAAEFTPGDADLFGILATQAAIAIENAERFARVRQSGQAQAELHAREQAALHQSQLERSSLEATFDSLADAVLTTDLEGRIVRVNRRARVWVERGLEDVIGQRVDEVFPLVDELGRALSHADAASQSADETSLLRPNGERIPVERVTSPIRDDYGNIIGAVQVLRDVRPQREVEQLKANIISLVSHELRTPLSHIKGYASTLLQPDVEWDSEIQRDFIASIERQADRLGRLISDLLEISRLDAGGAAKLERAPVAPAVLIERGIRQAQPNAGAHPITSLVPSDLPLVLADVGHLERVLSNLIENAAKYSPADTPIQVEVDRHDDEIAFAVHDQGNGMTREEMSHLFERFYRSPRVKHRTPGTGLGLAICREIVQAHGGRIWAESEEGKGSIFRFTLPLAPPLISS